MKIEYYTNDFPYIIIDDVYTEKECEMILADYDRINEKGKLVDASYTNERKIMMVNIKKVERQDSGDRI